MKRAVLAARHESLRPVDVSESTPGNKRGGFEARLSFFWEATAADGWPL